MSWLWVRWRSSPPSSMCTYLARFLSRFFRVSSLFLNQLILAPSSSTSSVVSCFQTISSSVCLSRNLLSILSQSPPAVQRSFTPKLNCWHSLLCIEISCRRPFSPVQFTIKLDDDKPRMALLEAELKMVKRTETFIPGRRLLIMYSHLQPELQPKMFLSSRPSRTSKLTTPPTTQENTGTIEVAVSIRRGHALA
jgi:hypothetical protein